MNSPALKPGAKVSQPTTAYFVLFYATHVSPVRRQRWELISHSWKNHLYFQAARSGLRRRGLRLLDQSRTSMD
jgi:hypothetical protein